MKTHRFAAAALVLLVAIPSVFAVNDFWLGNRYSVGVSFTLKHEAFIDPPKLKRLPMPSYPIELLEAGVQGHAKIQFLVREDGSVADVSVVSADSEEFGIEAKKAVAAWSFTPGKNRNGGKPAAVRMQCDFDFELNEKTQPQPNASNARPEPRK